MVVDPSWCEGMRMAYRTILYLVQSNLTGVTYRSNILQPLVLSALQAIGSGTVLQHHKAGPHRARVVNDFLQEHQVNCTDWLASSLDLNPTEHLWDVLGQ